MNQGAWMGRLTADPKLETTPSGVEYCRFLLAIDRGSKDKDGNKLTDFLPFTAWRKTAAFIEKYFRKGDMLAVIGSVHSRNFRDQEGKDRISYNIEVDHAEFCGGKRQDAQTYNAPFQGGIPGADDEMPF
jgi:single-strand DNA-binding protein